MLWVGLALVTLAASSGLMTIGASGAAIPREQASIPVRTEGDSYKLTASDGAAGENFGSSVAISGDTAIVGANWDDDNGDGSGSAYVFVRNGTGWSQQAKLTASDGAPDDWFGYSVAVSGDRVVVSAHGDDDRGYDSGSAYVFVRDGTSWSQQAKLTTSDGAALDAFGCAAISGGTIIVGAHNDDDKGDASGSAYIFVRDGTGWSQQAKLTASDGASGDHFGWAVAVSGDTAVVGALDDDDSGTSSGSAYVFVRSGTTWTQQAKLAAGDGTAYDEFGRSAAISIDTTVVGAHGDDDRGDGSGSAYVFVRNGTSWSQQAKLTGGDGATGDAFGWAVAASGDKVIIGAPYDNDQGDDSGSAYVFTRLGAVWSQHTKLTAGDGAAYDAFGYSAAISGGEAVVGAPYDDDNGAGSGSAYAHELFPGLCAIPLTAVEISGPTKGHNGMLYTFSAAVEPADATLPVTYTWAPEPQAGQGSPDASYSWSAPGVGVITVAAENCGGTATDSHTITVRAAVYLPLILRHYSPPPSWDFALLPVGPTYQSTLPDTVVTFRIDLRHLGNVADTYGIWAEPATPLDWIVQFCIGDTATCYDPADMQFITLQRGAPDLPLYAKVVVPAGAPDGSEGSVGLKVQSQTTLTTKGQTVTVHVETVVPTPTPYYNFVLDAFVPSEYAIDPPAAPVELTFSTTLTHFGNRTDTYLIWAEDHTPTGWTMQFCVEANCFAPGNAQNQILAPGAASVNLSIKITVPAGALPGTVGPGILKVKLIANGAIQSQTGTVRIK